MGRHPSRQHDLFEPLQRGDPLPSGVQTRLRPLNALAEPVEPESEEVSDDQDHA